MNRQEFLNLCWNHYLALESDFIKVERYISFENDNFECYSVEFIKQYLAICSEVDVICKIYCEVLDSTSQAKDILDYGFEILGRVPNIKNAVVKCGKLEVEPLSNWSTNIHNHRDGNDSLNIVPDWWRMYNKVKHQRVMLDSSGKPYYKQANLKNTLNALAGLFVLCMNCYKEICEKEGGTIKVPYEPSTIFKYKDWESGLIMFPGGICLSEV